MRPELDTGRDREGGPHRLSSKVMFPERRAIQRSFAQPPSTPSVAKSLLRRRVGSIGFGPGFGGRMVGRETSAPEPPDPCQGVDGRYPVLRRRGMRYGRDDLDTVPDHEAASANIASVSMTQLIHRPRRVYALACQRRFAHDRTIRLLRGANFLYASDNGSVFRT